MKHILYAAMILLGLGIMGCQKEEPKPDPELSVSQTLLTFRNEGGREVIHINFTGSWTITSSQNWCTVSPSSGTFETSFGGHITVFCDRNPSSDGRACTLTIKAGALIQTVDIMQGDGNNGLFVEQPDYVVTKEEQTLKIKVKVNTGYDVTIDEYCTDWISFIETKDLSETVVSLKIAQNTGGKRTGKVIIGKDAIIDEVNIIQDGFPPENNQIYYNSIHGAITEPFDTFAFGGATIVSNEYVTGTGIITFDKDLTSIGDNAFDYCSGLTSVVIPEGVTSLGYFAFGHCSNLTSINIPEGVTSIGKYTFSGCSSLASINIPERVTYIKDHAFADCSSLTSIHIPEGVWSIGDYAFSGCSSLTSINIPEGVTSIGSNAFYGCKSLTSINIPEKVKSIGQYTFYGCSMLTKVFCHPVTPPSCGAYGTCFPSTTTIYVPMESVETYKQKWSDYADQIQGYEF